MRELLLLVVFAHVALYHAHAGDVLLDRFVERVVLVKHAGENGADLVDDETKTATEQRNHGEIHEGDGTAHGVGHREREDQHERRADGDADWRKRDVGSPVRRRWGRPYAATSVQKLGAATALLNMLRTIAILHKIRAQSGFARAYPHLRRAKNGVFSIAVLPLPSQFCNIRAPKLFMPADALPKLMFAPLRPRCLF